MTTPRDPERLLLDPACPDIQRDLLRHGAEMGPPPGAEQRVWLGVVGAIGATAAAGAAAGAAEASAKTATTAAKVNVAGLTGAKVLAIVTALAALGAFGVYLVVGMRSTPTSVAPAPAEPPAIAPQPPSTGETPPWESPPPADPQRGAAPGPRRPTRVRPHTRAAAAPPAAAPSPAARLGEETTLIRDARQALRGGDAARALHLLEACRRQFPAGVLQQERERLTIEALVKAGRSAEASTRAAQFLRRYPDSPHAGDIRALGLGGSGGR